MKQAGAVLGQAQIKLELELIEDLFIKLKTKEICWLLLLQLMTTTTENEFAFNLPTITGKHFNQLNWDIDWGTSLYPIAGNRVNCYTNFLERPSAPFRFVLRYQVMLMRLVIMLEQVSAGARINACRGKKS